MLVASVILAPGDGCSLASALASVATWCIPDGRGGLQKARESQDDLSFERASFPVRGVDTERTI